MYVSTEGVCVRLYVGMCVFKKTQLFTDLLLENCHEIALYRSVLGFIFLERSL